MAKKMIRVIINCGRCDNIRETIDGTGGHMAWTCGKLDKETHLLVMLEECPLEDAEETP